MKKAKKKLPIAIFGIAFIILIVVAGSIHYTRFLKDKYETGAINKLEEITEDNAEKIEQYREEIYKNLHDFSNIITANDDFEYANARNYFEEILADNGFLCMGLADTDGKAYLTDGSVKDVSEEKFYLKSFSGNDLMMEKIEEDGAINFILSIPMSKDDKNIGVIFAVIKKDVLNDIVDLSRINNQGTVLITDSYGSIVWSKSVYELSDKQKQDVNNSKKYNILDIIENKSQSNSSLVKNIKDNMDNQLNGNGRFLYEKEKYISYKRLTRNHWYIMTIAPVSVMDSEHNSVLMSSYIILLGFIILYVVTFFFVIRMQTVNRHKIEKIAYVDEITGGNSFEKFKKDVDKLIKNYINNTYAMVSIDVDKFKYINDIFGYEEGNKVIRFIWNEINNIIMEGETFAHKRADQFVLFLNADNKEKLVSRLENLTGNVLKREYQNEKNYEIVLSIGIYIIDRMNFQIDNAIDRADLTKKSIKGKHSQYYAIYDEKLRQKILKDQDIENRMEKALENREFKVYYQPKYDSKTCELASAEALVRWYNPKTGMIFPNEFISVFENNGFIVELDKYMFESVCSDIRKWIDEGYEVVPISVNLSQLQLYNIHFIEEYREILNRYNIPPCYVQLELTETTLFSEASVLNQIIDKLHDIGFLILMDDFGTGYSSLNMLKNVPVDILKLDKSFVDDIGDMKGDIVVSTIISLGQSLDMRIVAEGVETKEQFEFLRDIFCDEIQGYYFSRPISQIEFRDMMIKGAKFQ